MPRKQDDAAPRPAAALTVERSIALRQLRDGRPGALCGACRVKSVPKSSALLAVLLEQHFSIHIHFSSTDTGSSTENEDTMTLRTQIETAIRTSPDSGRAAIAVCRLLEDEVGLVRKGWCDDDAELLTLLKGTAADAELVIADDDELLKLVEAVAPEIGSTDHWDAHAQAIESALKDRLHAANKSVTPANLMQELAECAEADLEAILDLDNVPAAELATLRKLVHVRIQLTARGATLGTRSA